MINFMEYIRLLQKKIKIIILISLAAVLLSTIYASVFVKGKYEAKVKLYIGKEKFQNVAEVYNNEEVTMYQQLMKTYSEVVKTKNVASNAISKGNLNIGEKELLGNLSVSLVSDTQLMEIKYSSYDMQESYDVLYAVTEEVIGYSRELYKNGNVKVLEQVTVNNENIAVKKLKIILLGFFAGLVVGIAVVILSKIADNTFNCKEDLENEFKIQVLGSIPVEN